MIFTKTKILLISEDNRIETEVEKPEYLITVAGVGYKFEVG